MTFQVLRFSIFFGALALIVGCGASPASNGAGSGSSPAVVTFTVTGITPTAVATKIGSGPFTPATLTSGTVTLSLPKGVNDFAVAYTCSFSFPPNGLGPAEEMDQDVYEATTLDGSAFTGPCLNGFQSPTVPPMAFVTGVVDVSAIPGASSWSIVNFDSPAATGSATVLVLAYDATSSPPALAGSEYLVAAKNFENQAVPGVLNGGNTVVLATSDETTPVSVTLGSLPAGYTLEEVTAQLMSSSFSGGIYIAAPATTRYPALPAGAMESGEYYSIFAEAGINGGGAGNYITRTTPTAVPVTFTFPAPWSYAGPSPSSMPTFDLSYPGFSSNSNLRYELFGSWTPAGTDVRYSTSVHATGNYLHSATSISWPDLSSMAGFFVPPDSGNYVQWTARIAQTTYESQPASPADATVTTVTNSSHYIVP